MEIVRMILIIALGIVFAIASLVFGKIYYQKRFDKVLDIKFVWYIVLPCICGLSAYMFERYGYGITKEIRLLFLMAALFIIGEIDSREQIIPNKILIVLLILRTVLLIVDCICYPQEILAILLSAGLGMIYGSAVFLIARIFTKKSIGMGDIKLFGVIGYYLGSSSIFPALIVSLIVAMVYGLSRVIRKKMTVKDSISFGPSIAIGTILVMFLGVN